MFGHPWFEGLGIGWVGQESLGGAFAHCFESSQLFVHGGLGVGRIDRVRYGLWKTTKPVDAVQFNPGCALVAVIGGADGLELRDE